MFAHCVSVNFFKAYYSFVDMKEAVGPLIEFSDEPGLPLPVQTALTTKTGNDSSFNWSP